MLAVLRSNRDVRRLFLAQVSTFAGDWFAYVAFVGLVQDLSDRLILVTAVYVALTLPAFLFSPIAGPVVDRFDRRTVIVGSQVAQTAGALGLLLVGSSGTLWIGFACLCLISAFGSFVGPASQAALPNLVESDEELKHASVLFGSLWGAMLAVGAALGGLVATQFGRDAAFLANAASFVIAGALVASIRSPMQQPTEDDQPRQRMRPLADMAEALGVARRDPVLLALLASKATFAMGAGIVGLLAVLVTQDFGGGDDQTGLLFGLRGIGVALGPVIAARFAGPSLASVLRICGLAGGLFGVCYLGLAVAPSVAVAIPFVLVAHLGGGAQWTLSTYGLQRRAPDHLRGRILAGDFGVVTLIITVSSLVAGGLADVAGARPAIAVFAVIGIAASIAYLLLTRSLRSALATAEVEGA